MNEQKITQSPQSTIPPVVNNPGVMVMTPRSRSESYQKALAVAQGEKGLAATIFSLVFGMLFTETVFLGATGISVTVLTLLYCAFILYYFHEKGEKLSRAGVALTLPAVVISAGFGLHFNPIVQLITIPALTALVFVQTMLLSGCKVHALLSLDTVVKALRHLLARPLSFLDMPFRSLAATKKIKSKAANTALKVVAGLALALPLGGLLLLLFARADSVFESGLNYVMQSLNISFGKLIADVLLGSTGAIFLSALFIAAKAGGKEQLKERIAPRFLDKTVATAFLVMVNVILLLFVAVQFQYLFAGNTGRTISGLTYAEYARKGFFELAWASGLCFAAVMFILFFCKKGEKALPLAVRILTALMCLCNGVVLASAILRMTLYVQVYGLSIKRVFTLWFMAVVGVCLLWLLLQCVTERVNALRLMGGTIIAFVCVLSLFNVDRTIASYNIGRYLQNPEATELDVSYLNELSYSALPEVAALYNGLNAEAQPALRASVGEELTHMREMYRVSHKVYGFTTQSPELSSYLN